VPEKWKLKEKPKTKSLLSGLRRLIRGLSPSDIVVNAGDADVEGQTLIDEILEYCGWEGVTERIRVNDLNPGAVRRALDNIRGNASYKGQYLAGQARMRSDWLVGLTLTRFVTVSLREAGYDAGVISVGRVQTPTLGLVVERDREIREFVPSPYFDLRAVLELDGGRIITGRWIPGDSHEDCLDAEKRVTGREFAEAFAAALNGAAGVVTKVEKHTRRAPPPLPFSLSKLQMAASKKYDITDALVHTQRLYESGYVTYPRTPCEYIPEGHFQEAPKVMDAIRASCPSLSDMMAGADLSRRSAAWDTSKITEHHAIIPTVRIPLEGALSDPERKIYELVCARYALQFLPDLEYEETAIEFESAGERREMFKASGRTVLNPGWQGWDRQNGGEGSDGDENPENIPSVSQGEEGAVQPLAAEKMTSPPKSYSYHSLLSAMNNIHLYVKDPEIRAKLKEIQGIGTEATQESVIAVLFKRGYLEKEKKQVISTPLGRLLIGLLNGGGKNKASVLVRPDLTALWERKMGEIEGGALALDSFVSEVADMVRGIISNRLAVPADVSIPGIVKQPKCLTNGCEGFLRHISKPGKSAFFSCPVCHTTFNDVDGSPVQKKKTSGEIAEAPCPLGCGGSARRFEGRYGPFWKCRCSPDVIFKDSNGWPAAPEQRMEAGCPVPGCGGKAVRFTRKKDGGHFWKCAKCGNFFNDIDGVPIAAKGSEAGPER
jgi:DNA topoisomerase-3